MCGSASWPLHTLWVHTEAASSVGRRGGGGGGGPLLGSTERLPGLGLSRVQQQKQNRAEPEEAQPEQLSTQNKAGRPRSMAESSQGWETEAHGASTLHIWVADPLGVEIASSEGPPSLLLGFNRWVAKDPVT